jgi:N-acetylmuramoyl-L-alanine amidase CwlA
MITVNVDNPPFIEAKYYRKGRIKPVELIIIHTMEAARKENTAENVANYFKNPEKEASAHYCIDSNSIVQCVYDSNTAFGCKNANANGVHLEHAGYAKQNREDWLDEYGKSMLDISAQVCAYLCQKFNIPVQMAEFRAKDTLP